jgi:single-strand DNA-binding protein
VYNRAFIIGNLTRDPEMRYTPSGKAVTKFTLAVNRRSKKTDSESAEVDFINIESWDKLAEICGEYLKKGAPVSIIGRLQIDSYEKDGETRTYVKIVANDMQMLGRKGE